MNQKPVTIRTWKQRETSRIRSICYWAACITIVVLGILACWAVVIVNSGWAGE